MAGPRLRTTPPGLRSINSAAAPSARASRRATSSSSRTRFMTQKRFDRLTRSARAEDGMALLIAVVVLLLMSALGLAALQHAGDEASGSGQARRKDATLYAADSGIKMIQVSLLNNVATSSANPVTLDQPTLI